MERVILKEEKPKYGWYVRNLIIGFLIVGLIGLAAFISGFFLKGLLSIVLLICGSLIMIVFLWPGLGMSFLNMIVTRKASIVTIMSALNEIKEPQILDVGCGTGRTAIRIAKALTNGGHLTGIDIYEKLAISGNALETIQRNAQIEKVDDRTTFQYGTATDIPFEDGSFDIVNVSSVLHEIHGVRDQEKAVQELYRVLKPGGYLYVGEWNRRSWQIITYAGIFCLVFKNRTYWEKLIKEHNFKNITYENLGGFGLFTARK